jgi:FkbM family methyltransferase
MLIVKPHRGKIAKAALMLPNIAYLAARLRRSWGRPRNLRFYEAQTEPFLYRSRFGLTFELHPNQYIDREIAVEGLYEDRVLAFIGSLLPKHAVALDVGSNIGNHALYLSKLCLAVHCFEPNPRALQRLKRNIQLNDITNVTIHPFGVGDTNKAAQFYDNVDGNLGGSSFVEAQGSAHGAFNVVELSIRNGDEAVKELELSRCDIIKVDVEGMEEAVFKGLQQTISRFRPLITFEFLGNRLGAEELARIASLLPDYDLLEPCFSPPNASIWHRTKWTLTNGTKATLVPIGIPEPRWYENILAVPDERRSLIDAS